MTYDPADKRALFQRVVDAILDEIRDGKLLPGDRLPSAKEISDNWDVSSMTAQRALRELQTMGMTYGMAGKGTFVHPEAPARIRVLDGEDLSGRAQPGDVITDPELNARLARYLLKRDEMVAKTLEMFDALRDKTTRDRIINEIGRIGADLEAEAAPLDAELKRYRTRLAQAAGQPDDTDAQPPVEDTPKRTRRSTSK